MKQSDLDRAVELTDKLVTYSNDMQEDLLAIREAVSEYHEFLMNEIQRMKIEAEV